MFSARSRIASGVSSLVVSILLIALSLNIMPDHREVARHGRAMLCEAIAANSSVMVRQRDIRRLQAVLELVLDRNEEILSAAVRRSDGSLAAEVGDHTGNWVPLDESVSSDTQVMVPIRANNTQWGTVELRFRPQGLPGLWGVLLQRRSLFVGFVGVVTLVLTYFYLGRTLKQMDPSKVVPGRVRSALDTLAEGLLVLDQNGRIMLANQAFSGIVGKPPEQLMGRLASELPWIRRENETELGYPWELAQREEASLAGMMLNLQDHEGKRRSFMVNCTPILGNDGQSRGVLASFEDVTQLEETQQELSRSKEAADAANRAKSEFLARMSHEIRTPMNAILGFTDVLRRGFESNEAERQEYLDTIHASGNHLLNLINDILDLSKVESGRLEVERIRCAPLQLIEEAVTVLRGQAENKGISLQYETPAGVPETIFTDPVRFRQLLTNLIGNAIKFTEQGGVRVVVRLIDEQGQSQLAIDVADSGIGIPTETLDRIFEPFVQADNSVTRRFGGTGLGLAISRRFAEALGGELTVRSTFGQGSVFTFTVDTGSLEGVRMVTVNDLSSQPRVADCRRDIEGQLPPAHILVVDDGDSNRKLINLVLTRAGARVRAARNGKEAVEACRHMEFDAILMDMQMPVMDGYTATTILREHGYEGPIVALTADAMKGTEERCREVGCTAFLTKPIDMDALIEFLTDILVPNRDGAAAACRKGAPALATGPVPLVGEPIHSSLPTDDIDFCEIIAEFEQRLREQLRAMQDAARQQEFTRLAELAHWLKGSGGMAGFALFTQPAQELQRLAEQGRVDGRVQALLAELEDIADRIVVPDLAGSPSG